VIDTSLSIGAVEGRGNKSSILFKVQHIEKLKTIFNTLYLT